MRKILVFLNFIITTLFLCIIVFIVAPFDRKGEKVHTIGRLWAIIHMKVCGIGIVLKGEENILKPPYIFMCNHQSALDIFSLLASLPLSFKWIAKRELFFIPFFGWALKRAGNISVDRKRPREAMKVLDETVHKIREGTNIVLFPEGTRSQDGTLLPFKKGSFSLALRALVPIVPVGICGSSNLQPKGSFVPRGKGVVYIKIGKPIPLEDASRHEKDRIASEVRSSIERLIACQEN